MRIGSQVEINWHDVPRRSQWIFEIPQVIGIVFVICVSLWLKPDGRLYGTHEQLGLAPCPMIVMWGIPCPSCGLTTSFALMSRGRVARAFEANYSGPFLYAGMLGYLALLVAFVVRKQRVKIEWPSWVPVTLLFGAAGLYFLTWGVRLLKYI